jgi:hypothetical protein
MRPPIRIEAEQTVLIDALQGDVFLVRLTTSIRQLILKNASPGQLYVFVFTQDAVGGRTVQWGGQTLNGSSVMPDPDATTVQSFIANAGGTLQANLPATWSA